MAAAVTLSNKSSLKDSSKHSSPIINERESFSPDSSSLATLSPQSTNSISSPDKSFVYSNSSNDQRYPSTRLIDYFVVSGLDKYFDVEPSSEPTGKIFQNEN